MSNRFRTNQLLLSGALVSATGSSLFINGQTVGADTSNFATISNLQSTGISLKSSIDLISGDLITTGQTLYNYITSTSGNLDARLSQTGVDLLSLIGASAAGVTSLQVTGFSVQSGAIRFSGLGNTVVHTGLNNFIYFSGTPSDGINLSGNLTTTGQTLYNLINNFSGVFNNSGTQYQTQLNTLTSNLQSTGISLKSSLDLISGNLIITGQTLDNKINSVSGWVNNTPRVSALNVTGFGNQTGIIGVSGLGTITIFTGEGNFIYVSGAAGLSVADHGDGINLSGNLTTTGQVLYGYITTASGNLDSRIYQTGSNLYNLINNFSGIVITGSGGVSPYEGTYMPIFTADGKGITSGLILQTGNNIMFLGPSASSRSIFWKTTIGSSNYGQIQGNGFATLIISGARLNLYAADNDFINFNFGNNNVARIVNSGRMIISENIVSPAYSQLDVSGIITASGGNFTNSLLLNGEQALTGIIAGTNITTQDNNNGTFTINATAGGGGGAAVTGISITGSNYFSGIDGRVNLTGLGSVSLFLNSSNNIQISGTAGASSDTASNLGVGLGIFAQKSAGDFQFYSITGGTGSAISQSGSTILVSSFPEVTGIGSLFFEDNMGQVAAFDANITGGQTSGTVNSYSFNIDGTPIATIYSEYFTGLVGGSPLTGLQNSRFTFNSGSGNNLFIQGNRVLTGISSGTDISIQNNNNGSFTIHSTRSFSRGGTIIHNTGVSTGNYIIWRSQYNCTVTGVHAYRVGGSSATINARKNDTLNNLITDMSLTSTGIWFSSGIIQNSSYNQGDKLEININSIGGAVTQVAIQVDFTKV